MFIFIYIMMTIGIGLCAVNAFFDGRKYSKFINDYESTVEEMLELSKRQQELSIALTEHIKKRQF